MHSSSQQWSFKDALKSGLLQPTPKDLSRPTFSVEHGGEILELEVEDHWYDFSVYSMGEVPYSGILMGFVHQHPCSVNGCIKPGPEIWIYIFVQRDSLWFFSKSQKTINFFYIKYLGFGAALDSHFNNGILNSTLYPWQLWPL